MSNRLRVALIGLAIASCGDDAYSPWLDGIYFGGLGALLGTCVSPCMNPTGQPVLDCEMLAAHVPR